MVLIFVCIVLCWSWMLEVESKSGECVGLFCILFFFDFLDFLVCMGFNLEIMVCSFLYIKCCFNLIVIF